MDMRHGGWGVGGREPEPTGSDAESRVLQVGIPTVCVSKSREKGWKAVDGRDTRVIGEDAILATRGPKGPQQSTTRRYTYTSVAPTLTSLVRLTYTPRPLHRRIHDHRRKTLVLDLWAVLTVWTTTREQL